MILHATHKWPYAITPHLWSYVLKMVNEIRNITPRSQDGLVPIAHFAETNQVQQLVHLHPFGFPVYVLHTRLQQSKKIDKWQQRSRIAAYLGQSEKHACTVHLVLSIKTGLVSPQYNVKFDNYFETTRWKEYLPKSLWQIKARLVKPPPSSSPDLDPETLTKTLGHAQKGGNMEVNSSPQSGIHQREGTEIPNNDSQIITTNEGPTQ